MPESPPLARTPSFLDLLTADEAYAAIDRLPSLDKETVAVRDAVGRVLARDVAARDDVPHFFRSNMDGFAVRAADTEGASESSSVRLRIAGSVAMGAAPKVALAAGEAVRVSTGGMMPEGADAVVIVERTEELGDGTVSIRAEAEPLANTVAIGEDMRSGDRIYSAGQRIRPVDVGALCGVGLTQVPVHLRPRVSVLATGDEIVEPDQPLGPGQVRNINEYLLEALAVNSGARVVDHRVVADDERSFGAALERAVATSDAIFISGGSSKGARDLTRGLVEALPDSSVIFHGLAIAPGKPTLLARAGSATVLGVPGNPAAAAVVFTLFGTALLGRLEGEPVDRLRLRRPRVRARLAEDLRSPAGREDYLRVRLERDGPDPTTLPTAVPIRGKSVAISTVALAHGLLAIGASSEGLERGDEVEVVLF